MTDDIYFKKNIVYPFEGEKFIFAVAETLFSTFDIDHGTDILIRNIALANPQTILDLGCGYGPLGIILAKKYPKAKVLMESVGEQKFDLIVSNIPAKIGDEAITRDFILTPYSHLNPNGELWVVVVNALNRLIPKIGTQNNLNVKEIKKRSGHTVYRINMPGFIKTKNKLTDKQLEKAINKSIEEGITEGNL